jgi:hypothetical protein
MADMIFNNFKKNIMNGTINLASDTIQVGLVTSAYTPNQDTHEFWSSVTNEVTGTGYTAVGASGKALTTKAVTEDTTNDRGVFDADDVTWATSTITARAAVLVKWTGSAATSPLIAYIDFGSDKSSSSGDFTIQWNAAGILTLS